MSTDLVRPLSLDFGKSAQGYKVGQDPNSWATEVLKHVAEEHPYLLAGTQVNPVWKATDARSGFGFGGLYISNAPAEQPQYMNYGEVDARTQNYDKEPVAVAQEAVQTIIVPMFVANYELKPLDVFVYNRKVYPLTERRVAGVIESGRIFGADEPPMSMNYYGDAGDASLVDKLYPPSEAIYGAGYGGGGQDYSAAGHGITSQASVGHGKTDAPSLSDMIGPTVLPAHADELFAFCKQGEDEMGLMMGAGLEGFLQKIISHAQAAKEQADVDQTMLGEGRVVRIRGAAGRDGIFEVTEIPDDVYEPRSSEMSLGDVLEAFEDDDPAIRQELLSGGTVLLTMEHKVQPTAILEDFQAQVDPVVGEGTFYLLDRDGDVRPYYVCPQVVDFADRDQEGAKIFCDGQAWGLQVALMGDPAPAPIELPEGRIEPGTWGTFSFKRNGANCMTLPFKIRSQTIDLERSRLSLTVMDLYGYEHLLIVTPKIQKIMSSTGITNADLGSHVGGNIWHVPSSYRFISLGRKTSAAEHPDQMERGLRPVVAAAVERHIGAMSQKDFQIEGDTEHVEARRRASEKVPIATPNSPRTPGAAAPENTLVAVRKLPSPGLFELLGHILEYTENRTHRQELSEKEAIFVLATLGMSLDGASGVLARAAETPSAIHVAGLRPPAIMPVKQASERPELALLQSITDRLRSPLWKEAAAISLPIMGCRNLGALEAGQRFLGLEKKALDVVQPEDQTIDQVLSLGLINPQNIATFLEKIDELKESESCLAQLLVLIRLGMQGIEEKPVSTALKSLNRVVEGLEALASYGEQPQAA
jgi:hypothetical protein